MGRAPRLCHGVHVTPRGPAKLASALVALTLAVPSAAAETAIGRSDAARLGASQGPSTRAASAAAAPAGRVASASTFFASVPRLGVLAGERRGPTGAGLEVGATLTQDLPIGGVGRARADLGRWIAAERKSDLERARLEAAGLATLAWVDALEAEEIARLRRAAVDDARALEVIVRARVTRGVALPYELHLAEAESGEARAALIDAEGALTEAAFALRFTTGLPNDAAPRAVGALCAADGPRASDEAALLAVDAHPEVRLARDRIGLAEADARVARAQASPPLGVGVSVTREGTGEVVWTGLASIPLPLFDPGAFEGRHRDVVAAEARGELERARAATAQRLRLALHEREHARELRDVVRSGVLGPLDAATRVARAGWESGGQEITSFLATRQRKIRTEERLARACGDVQRADVHVDLARGALAPDEARR